MNPGRCNNNKLIEASGVVFIALTLGDIRDCIAKWGGERESEEESRVPGGLTFLNVIVFS